MAVAILPLVNTGALSFKSLIAKVTDISAAPPIPSEALTKIV